MLDDLSSRGAEQSQDALDEGGLTPAVGTDDAEKVTLVDFQVDIVEHSASVVGGRKAPDGEEGGRGCSFRMLVAVSFFIHRLVGDWEFTTDYTD